MAVVVRERTDRLTALSRSGVLPPGALPAPSIRAAGPLRRTAALARRMLPGAAILAVLAVILLSRLGVPLLPDLNAAHHAAWLRGIEADAHAACARLGLPAGDPQHGRCTQILIELRTRDGMAYSAY